jgi:hypothetical protein
MTDETKRIEDDLVEFLARVYRVVPWRRLRVRSPREFFGHRVLAASRRATLYEMAERLGAYLGLSGLPVEAAALLDGLRADGLEAKAMRLLSLEHLVLCARAFGRARELRSASGEEAEATAEEGHADTD